MKYIILISSHSYQLNDMEKKIPSQYKPHSDNEMGSLSIKVDDDNIIIRRSDDVIDGFDNEEKEIIHTSIKAPEIYLINYHNVESVKTLLKYIANTVEVFIDNDCGLLVTGKEFIKLCDERKGWDWLKECGVAPE